MTYDQELNDLEKRVNDFELEASEKVNFGLCDLRDNPSRNQIKQFCDEIKPMTDRIAKDCCRLGDLIKQYPDESRFETLLRRYAITGERMSLMAIHMTEKYLV